MDGELLLIVNSRVIQKRMISKSGPEPVKSESDRKKERGESDIGIPGRGSQGHREHEKTGKDRPTDNRRGEPVPHENVNSKGGSEQLNGAPANEPPARAEKIKATTSAHPAAATRSLRTRVRKRTQRNKSPIETPIETPCMNASLEMNTPGPISEGNASKGSVRKTRAS